MSAPRFRVTSISLRKNLRGDELYQVVAHAMPGPVFEPSTSIEAPTPPEPIGEITMLVNKDYAGDLTLGAELALEKRS